MGKKVLIVDDAAFMRMMLKDILQKNDFEVVAEAENGKVGVAAYQKFKMMRSLTKSSPVVSKSKTTSGRIRFSFIYTVAW